LPKLPENRRRKRIIVEKKITLYYGLIFVINGIIAFPLSYLAINLGLHCHAFWQSPLGWMQGATLYLDRGTLLEYFSFLLIAFAPIWAIVWRYGSIKMKKIATTVGLLMLSGHSFFSFSLWSAYPWIYFLGLFFLPIPLLCFVTTSLFWYRFWKEYVVRTIIDLEALYEHLTQAYTGIHGVGKPFLDKDIESYVKSGSSREEAIRNIDEEVMGITTLATLQIIAGLIGMTPGLYLFTWSSWQFVTWGKSLEATVMGAFGGFKALVGIIDFVVAYGYLKRKDWAWTLGSIFAILGILADLNFIGLFLFLGVDAIINVSIIYLLTRPHIQRFFGKAFIPEPMRNQGEPYKRLLYERLLHVYTYILGGGKQALDNTINSLMKQGLSQEEAVYRLAEKERLIKGE